MSDYDKLIQLNAQIRAAVEPGKEILIRQRREILSRYAGIGVGTR